MSIAFGSMPAAAILAVSKPTVAPAPGPKPVSISTSLEPVLTTIGLNGTVTWPLGM